MNLSEIQANAMEAARKQGLGRLMLLARENFFARMEEATGDLFAPGMLRRCATLMPFIDIKGTRSTELARRMGVTKQAVGRTIKVLIDEGIVECVSDPEDGRAFLVRFTPGGLKRLNEMHAAIRRVEQDLDRELGADRIQVAREVLFEMAYGVPPGAPSASGSRPRRAAESGRPARL